LPIDTEKTYRQYGPMVLRRCRQLLHDEERARDAMHDVFVKLLRYQDRLEDQAPSSLLYRIATNVCLNQLRATRRRPEVPEDSVVEHIAHTADPESSASTRGVLARLFGGEVESSAVIAVLHHHDGMTLDEVAREVGMSVSGVRKRLRKLRDRLPWSEGSEP
jgi:RNA polymerase sigma-70 factor (ECF subfamily)